MKYLLIGLFLVLSALGHSGNHPPVPQDAGASAEFLDTTPAGVRIDVVIGLNATGASYQVTLSIRRTVRSCADAAPCQHVAGMTGDVVQSVPPADSSIDPFLNRASVHAAMPFHDDVSGRDLVARVDLVWTATGPRQCDVFYRAVGCLRFATVTGDVTAGTTWLIAGQSIDDGQLAWRPTS